MVTRQEQVLNRVEKIYLMYYKSEQEIGDEASGVDEIINIVHNQTSKYPPNFRSDSH